MPWATLLVLVLGGLVFWFALERAGELFCVSMRDGRLLVVRGAVPPSLLHDLGDVLKRAGVRSATVRAVRSSGHARLVARGVDDRVLQRLRNTLGVHPIHKLRAAPLPSSRNLGQLLGIVWLAWLLTGRRGPDA